MTKSEHKQRAMDMAYQVKRCYSKTAKRQMAGECLEDLRKSLKEDAPCITTAKI